MTPPLKRLLPYYRQNAGGFVLGFALLATAASAAAAIPWTMKLATDALSRGGAPEEMRRHALQLAFLAIANGLFRVAGRSRIFHIGRQIEYDLRRQYQAKLQELDTLSLSRERVGDLVTRGTGDLIAIRMFIGSGFLQAANALLVYAITL
ncbi:MAG: hypothetical protein HQL59_13310, partial [Magnetococcales bacterium]|nr:hypothetical protein [Magnetococcales bacterium]